MRTTLSLLALGLTAWMVLSVPLGVLVGRCIAFSSRPVQLRAPMAPIRLGSQPRLLVHTDAAQPFSVARASLSWAVCVAWS